MAVPKAFGRRPARARARPGNCSKAQLLAGPTWTSNSWREDRMRGVRLQIDYLKPELLLEEHGIRNTIVVFGSTRICEPAAARRKVETLKAALADDPGRQGLGAPPGRRRAHSGEEPLLRRGARIRPPGERGEPNRRGAALHDRDGRRAGNHGGRQSRRLRRRRRDPSVSTSACRMSNIPIPTSRPGSASTFTTSRCASCTFSCEPRRWSPVPEGSAPSTSCSRRSRSSRRAR